MSNTKHFGRKVRERRENRGWSLECVAKQCNISDKCLEKIELGDTDPKLSTVLKVAAVLEINMGELNSCLPTLV